jgi:hypothetical protein
MQWNYERGEHRRKQRWKNDFPGFEPSDPKKSSIGKCPKHVNEAIAREALNSGVPFFDSSEAEDEGNAFSSKIYMVYQGVIYEAAVTTPGKSFHGYPWRALPGRPSLPKSILHKLEIKIKTEEEKQIFKEWLKKYGA